ncbi:branched-chain amino acid ABC transporter permease [Streptomyces sp. NPDC002668]|uniref:branched-chain amino acid ABC transporter permease n=1 Tax=Streptomyces sp. NPDC002668 TaxID=3154422 RepID=UPI0033206594
MTTLLQQTLNGLVGGAFYALLALGLAVIFGVLRVINFAHGALFMLGAFGAVALGHSGLGFWTALALVPIAVGVLGMILEWLFVRRLATSDRLYNFLLTFGIALVLQDLIRMKYGGQAQPYDRIPLNGQTDLGLFTFPTYQLFVLAASVVACLATWLLLTRTRAGVVVRAATERPELARAYGINVARWVTPVFGFGCALAGLAGVLAAPMRAVTADMGGDLIVVIFAVVVIGGMGSVFGAVVAGFAIGAVQAVGNLYVPALSQVSVFALMAVVIMMRPVGLFGKEEHA